ncbi:MAG: glutathione S-transferase N-terminal domain-containing protein [Burkholderiales bacterium]
MPSAPATATRSDSAFADRHPCERIAVDLAVGEQRTAAYRQLNPRGQVPVLDDGGTVIWDSTAILVYLARRLGREDLLPLDALGMAPSCSGWPWRRTKFSTA